MIACDFDLSTPRAGLVRIRISYQQDRIDNIMK